MVVVGVVAQFMLADVVVGVVAAIILVAVVVPMEVPGGELMVVMVVRRNQF